MRPSLVLTAATAIALATLFAGMRHDAFFSGDSGLKLIASLNVLAHPDRPLELDLPRIGGRSVPYVEHMISVHGDHAHVLQSPLFPVITAPFIRAFGIRGIYVLPLVSFVALVPLLDAMRRRAMPETSFAALAWIAVASNPVLFYALEYWEHAPAIALVAACLCAALFGRAPASIREPATDGRRGRHERAWIVASGALGGCAVLLRPEAAWVLASLLLIVERRHWIAFIVAAGVVLLPFGVVNLAHSGDPLGPHTSQSLAPLGTDWVAARWSRIRTWLWPSSLGVGVGLLLVAASRLPASVVNLDLRVRQLIGLAGVAIVSVMASQGWLVRDSLWQAFPLALLSCLPTRPTPLARRFSAIALMTTIAIVLTSTHDGGAQWGPRFLLISSPMLLLLAARSATEAASAGRARAVRLMLIGIVFIAGLMTARASYLEMRGSKRDYGRIVSATATDTAEGSVIVTNVWWFDQINASLYERRTFLFVPTPSVATQALKDLTQAGVHEVTLVWTEEPDGETLESATAGTCFQIDRVREVQLRALRYGASHCRHADDNR